jgi:hypothetical protein
LEVEGKRREITRGINHLEVGREDKWWKKLGQDCV